MIRFAVMVSLAAAAALAPASVPRAHAQSCSGGNGAGGGGGGGGSSSSGGGGGGGTDTTDVEVCRDTTEITGLTECSRFGQGWDASGWPALDFGVALQLEGITPSGPSFGGTVRHDDNPYRWTLGGDELGSTHAFGFRLRGTGFLTPWLYTGLEAGFGGGPAHGPRLVIGELEVEPDAVLVGDVGAVTGFAVPVGPFVLRAEVLAGLRVVGLSVETQRGACIGSDTDWHAELAIAPRVGVDWYLTPWLSVGAYGGTHVLGTGDWHGGLDLRVHTRSYNGQRGR